MSSCIGVKVSFFTTPRSTISFCLSACSGACGSQVYNRNLAQPKLSLVTHTGGRREETRRMCSLRSSTNWGGAPKLSSGLGTRDVPRSASLPASLARRPPMSRSPCANLGCGKEMVVPGVGGVATAGGGALGGAETAREREGRGCA